MAAKDTDATPFDAVLIVSFGGPQGVDDIRPFLANVLRGRRVPPERVEEVAHHYELFGGVSPLTQLTLAQAEGLHRRLGKRGIGLPVYVGMRNWHPLLADTLAEMSRAGVRRAIGFIAAAHHSYSSCQQYRENVGDARRELLERGLADIEITYVESWFDHPGFIRTNVEHIREALDALGPSLRQQARIVFTAHSIPTEMARRCRYAEQLVTSARLVVESLGWDDWALVYQSRSGRPQDPWLEPDICDYLRDQHGKGRLKAVVIAPIGFICDHVEVLYDLDREAADLCGGLALPMARARTVNDDPVFLDMMADVVGRTCDRYQRFPPLPIRALNWGAPGT
jgi:protoporphyrin/coproporphyrin ferrochelatase